MPIASRWPRRIAAAAAVAAAVPVLAFLEAGLESLHTLTGPSGAGFGWTFGRMLLPWSELAVLVPFVVLLAGRVPLGGRRPARAVALHAVASLLFGATHLFLVVVVARELRGDPIALLGFTLGLISRYMLQDVFLYWTLVGGIQVYRHRRALARSELVAARLTAELAEARLAALQARLEPHFLFNALNTAVMLVRDDRGEQAVDVLLQLSELLRTVIAGAPGHEVALCDEWTFVERYLTLERVRYGDRLDVRLSLAPGLERVRVPFLVLQPLVENALRHGVARRVDEGPGVVEVVARRDDASLRLEVRDNGPGPAAANGSGDRRGTGSHVGLASVRARLGALYGDRGTLELAGAQGGGMVATIRLPLTAVA